MSKAIIGRIGNHPFFRNLDFQPVVYDGHSSSEEKEAKKSFADGGVILITELGLEDDPTISYIIREENQKDTDISFDLILSTGTCLNIDATSPKTGEILYEVDHQILFTNPIPADTFLQKFLDDLRSSFPTTPDFKDLLAETIDCIHQEDERIASILFQTQTPSPPSP